MTIRPYDFKIKLLRGVKIVLSRRRVAKSVFNFLSIYFSFINSFRHVVKK